MIHLIYTWEDYFQSASQSAASVLQSSLRQDLYFLHTFIISEVLEWLETFLSPKSFCTTQKRKLSLEIALVHLFILYRMVSKPGLLWLFIAELFPETLPSFTFHPNVLSVSRLSVGLQLNQSTYCTFAVLLLSLIYLWIWEKSLNASFKVISWHSHFYSPFY